VSLVDDDARPIRKGSLATPTQFSYPGHVTDNRQGIVVDYEIEPGMPPDAPGSPPPSNGPSPRSVPCPERSPPIAATAKRRSMMTSPTSVSSKGQAFRPATACRHLAQGQYQPETPSGRSR
jgi:hypothetical protein